MRYSMYFLAGEDVVDWFHGEEGGVSLAFTAVLLAGLLWFGRRRRLWRHWYDVEANQCCCSRHFVEQRRRSRFETSERDSRRPNQCTPVSCPVLNLAKTYRGATPTHPCRVPLRYLPLPFLRQRHVLRLARPGL